MSAKNSSLLGHRRRLGVTANISELTKACIRCSLLSQHFHVLYASLRTSTMPYERYVDICFPIKANQILAEHGYLLYSAITGALPFVHSAEDLSISTLPGILMENHRIRITDGAKLRIRAPLERIPAIYPLAGKRLRIGDETVFVRYPTIEPLRPATAVRARIVLIKPSQHPESGRIDGDAFLQLAQRALRRLHIEGNVELETESVGESTVPLRRVLRIKDVVLPGFGVIVRNLTQEDSLTLQINGLGGRKKMGCGFFRPIELS